MLVELAVSNLGVIDEVRLLLGPGTTAVTGETGAGKTMLVEALELLVGGKADAMLVRPGADEAVVEGRFVSADDTEVVLTRVVPAVGRSRAYVNGRIAPAAALAESGADLVDLHGQHAHQSLLAPATQRAALDRYAEVDLEPLRAARREVASIRAALAELGGDERARAREIDLLRFQVAELDAAAVTDEDEDELLSREEDVLRDAVAHIEAAASAVEVLAGDRGAADLVGQAIAALAERPPYTALEARLRTAAAELSDVTADLRNASETIAEDPERLSAVRERRQLLRDLRRKYGDTMSEVLAYATEVRDRLAELEGRDERAAALDAELAAALARQHEAERIVGSARRAAAPELASAVEGHLRELAMARASVGVAVGDADPGDDVELLLAANPGAPPLALAKVASGGELARTMLALRLVLSGGHDDDTAPPTLVFDEVDAGIGGAAATAVGRALATLGAGRQVLVVTHLPQVAAFADAQIVVTKRDDGATTTATAAVVEADARVVEISRMLSGSPDSSTARQHASELLEQARRGT